MGITALILKKVTLFKSRVLYLSSTLLRYLWLIFIVNIPMGTCIAASAWQFASGVSISEIATDNAGLTSVENGENERITEVMPRFSLSRGGQRSEIDLAYRLRILRYSEAEESDEVFHQFSVKSDNEVVRDTVYLNAIVSHTQRTIDASQQTSFGNIVNTDNQTDTTIYSLSPVFRSQFGGNVNTELRYLISETRYDDEAVKDEGVQRQELSTVVESGVMFNRTAWKLSYNRAEYDTNIGASDDMLQETLFTLKYKAFSRLSFSVSAGYEDNELSLINSDTTPEKRNWSVGIEWAPSRRVFLSASTGKRFFGDTKTLTISRRHKTTEFSLVYDEQITSTAEELETRSVPVAEGGTDLLPDEGEVSATSITSDLFLRDRGTARFSWNTRRYSAVVEGYEERRSRDFDNQDETIVGGAITFNWTASKLFNVSISSRMQDRKIDATGIKDEFTLNEIVMNYNFRRRITGSLSFVEEEQTSDVPTNEYSQTIVSANLDITF